MDREDLLKEALRLAVDPPGGVSAAALRELTRGDDEADWDIATTATHLGVSPHTLRYYERVGLITIPRGRAGHRRFDAAAVRRLVFLTRMRVSGMSISDLRRYVDLVDAGRVTVPERLDLLLEHRDTLRAQIAQLQLSLAATEFKIATYQEGAATVTQHDLTTPENLARRRHGQEVLARIDGHQGEAVVDSLADISPALGHHIAAFAFGDIYDRPGLDARSRQLVTLGVLAALGGCEPQLRVHIGAALNVGISREEVVESFLHSAVYAGFPRAINATLTARDVFADRDLEP